MSNHNIYREKLERLIEMAYDFDGPPEAAFYGVWIHVLQNMIQLHSGLLVYPQLGFRFKTLAPTYNISTRYTDLCFYDSWWIERPGRTRKLVYKLIGAIEIKPQLSISEKLDLNDQEDQDVVIGMLNNIETQLYGQVKHHFASIPHDLQSPAVIGIVSAGCHWGWLEYRRAPGTPARRSTQTAENYLLAHPDLVDTTLSISEAFDLRTERSDEELEAIGHRLRNVVAHDSQ